MPTKVPFLPEPYDANKNNPLYLPYNPMTVEGRKNLEAKSKNIASPRESMIPEVNIFQRLEQINKKPIVQKKQDKIGGAGGAGGAAKPTVSPIDQLFKPAFDLLAQQRKQTDARYAANLGDITNIYGQLTSARKTDVSTSATAFKQLQDAAAARSTAINTSIDTNEAAQLSKNAEVLKSLGMEGRAATGAAAGDVASQAAQQAKDLNTVSQGQWGNLLDALGAAQASQIQGDISAYGFRQAEDQAMLGRDLLAAQQAKDAEQAKLTMQRSQAKFDYAAAQARAQASAAAAAQRATTTAAKQAAKDAQRAIDNSDPVTRIAANASKLGVSSDDIVGATTAYYDWLSQRGTQAPAGQTAWKLGSAQADAQKTAGALLSLQGKSLLNQMLAGSYKP